MFRGPRSQKRDLGHPVWLVEEGDLRGVACEALPVHVDAMPAVEGDGFVVAVADIAADPDLGFAGHATPGIVVHALVRVGEGAVLHEREAGGVLGADPDGFAAAADHFAAEVRFAARATAEGFVAVDDRAPGAEGEIRDEEPLALADGGLALDFRGPETGDCGLDIVDVVSGNGGGEPVPLIVPEKEFVAVGTVADHQDEMAEAGLHVEDLGCNFLLATDVEEFAGAVSGDVDSDLDLLSGAGLVNEYARTHAGEVPNQEFPGRHIAP